MTVMQQYVLITLSSSVGSRMWHWSDLTSELTQWPKLWAKKWKQGMKEPFDINTLSTSLLSMFTSTHHYPSTYIITLPSKSSHLYSPCTTPHPSTPTFLHTYTHTSTHTQSHTCSQWERSRSLRARHCQIEHSTSMWHGLQHCNQSAAIEQITHHSQSNYPSPHSQYP